MRPPPIALATPTVGHRIRKGAYSGAKASLLHHNQPASAIKDRAHNTTIA